MSLDQFWYQNILSIVHIPETEKRELPAWPLLRKIKPLLSYNVLRWRRRNDWQGIWIEPTVLKIGRIIISLSIRNSDFVQKISKPHFTWWTFTILKNVLSNCFLVEAKPYQLEAACPQRHCHCCHFHLEFCHHTVAYKMEGRL